MKEPLIFDIALGQTKPNSMHNRDGHCPFCEPSQLTDILDTSGSIIWLMNKYPVLKHTWPTSKLHPMCIQNILNCPF